MRPKFLATTLMLLSLGSCGILAAPVALPHVATSNHDIDTEIRFLDDQGNSIEHPEVRVTYEELHWDPWVIERPTESSEVYQPSKGLHLVRKSVWFLDVYVTKDGFAPTAVRLVPGQPAMPSVMTAEPLVTNWQIRYQTRGSNQPVQDANKSPIDIILHAAGK